MDAFRDIWNAIRLESLQKELDAAAEAIGKTNDECDASRKELVETTKSFRTEAPEDVRKRVAPLIKRFQAEVDSLSKRSKFAESSFLEVYKKISNAPDPVVLYDELQRERAKLNQLHQVEVENQKLRQTLEEYHAEFAEIKSQEATISRLEKKLKEAEEKTEEAVAARVKEKERQAQKQSQDNERALQEQCASLQVAAAEHAATIASLRHQIESLQSELIDVRNCNDEEQHARVAELDMTSSELERAQLRAASLQKELEMERQRWNASLTSSTEVSMDSTIDKISLSELKRELALKEEEIAQLLVDYQSLQSRHNDFSKESDRITQGLQTSLETAISAHKALEEQRQLMDDYDELKRENEMMKSMHFASSTDNTSTLASKSFEVLLVEKSRALDHENVTLKSQLAVASAKALEFEEKYDAIYKKLAANEALVSNLESDMLQLNAPVSQACKPPGSTEEAMLGSIDSSTDSSILPIIASQRDRFRSRNLELESENRHHQHSISGLKAEIDTLRADNVKLFEKIKFLQGYNGKPLVQSDDAVRKYANDYEDHINPFHAFSAQEQQRKLASLNTADKFSLSFGRLVLSNKIARTMFFFYMLLLHVLIFIVLLRMSHLSTSEAEPLRCRPDAAVLGDILNAT